MSALIGIKGAQRQKCRAGLCLRNRNNGNARATDVRAGPQLAATGIDILPGGLAQLGQHAAPIQSPGDRRGALD